MPLQILLDKDRSSDSTSLLTHKPISLLCVFFILCLSPYVTSAEYKAEYKEDEISASNLPEFRALGDLRAAFSTLPYLKRLGSGRIQPGTLYLYLSPQGARVYLDGKPLDKLEHDEIIVVEHEAEKLSFLTFEGLVPGTHTLRVIKSGHGAKLKYVSIEPGGTKSVNIKLHSRWRFLAAEAVILVSLAAIVIGVAALMPS